MYHAAVIPWDKFLKTRNPSSARRLAKVETGDKRHRQQSPDLSHAADELGICRCAGFITHTPPAGGASEKKTS